MDAKLKRMSEGGASDLSSLIAYHEFHSAIRPTSTPQRGKQSEDVGS